MAKVNEVNKCLNELCFQRNVLLIDHSKTLKLQDLNGSKLHLNRRGTAILQSSFTKVLSSIFTWQKDENSVASTPLLNEEYITEAKNYVDKININAELRPLRIKNLNKLIIEHLSINYLRNKFELLTLIKDNIDILWSPKQSLMKGFSWMISPHRFDRNCDDGVILLHIREDTPSKLLSKERDLTEAFFCWN